jgi:hypothetical protein
MSGLQYTTVEISWGSQWINLNDQVRYRINAEGTRDTTSKTWRKTLATSPILGGDYLVHAVPNMVVENISVYAYGSDQTELAENFWTLEELFEQRDYRIRWTMNEYREYWHCQLAEATTARGHIWSHNLMAVSNFAVPRYPDVTRERIN